MNIFIFNIIVVMLMAMVYPITNFDGIKLKKSKSIRPIAIFTFILLMLEMGLRGEFDNDTVTYYELFQNSSNESIQDVFSGRDLTYFLYSLLFARISDSYVLFLLSLAAIEAFFFVRFMTKESESFWLSLLILFCSGSFYTGFNIMRELIAASLFCNCYKYIYNQKFSKYVFFIILISTVHLSAILMLPIYFLPKITWRGKSAFVVIFSAVCISALFWILADNIFAYATLFMFQGYSDLSHFGVSEGVPLSGTIKSVIISGGVLLGYRYFDFSKTRDRLIYNGCFLNIVIAVCGMKIFMIQRLTHFLIPLIMVGYPLILSRIKNRSNRNFWLLIIIIMLVASILNSAIDNNYYFYWDNIRYRWD